MNKGLSEQQEMLLIKAAKNDGVLSMELATKLYSGKQAAKNAVTKLEVLGYIENTTPGYFKVNKVPGSVADELGIEEESDYEAEKVEE